MNNGRQTTKLNRKLVFSVLSLALVIVFLSLTAYSWYENNRSASVEGGDLTVKGEGSLQVAYDVSEDGQTTYPYDYHNGNVYNYTNTLAMHLSSSTMQDITGDGITFFTLTNRASVEAGVLNAVSDNGDNAAVTNDKGSYIVMNVYFRTDKPTDVYLLDTRSLISFDDKTNMSSYGKGQFSCNNIAAAARVAFSEFGVKNSNFIPPAHANLVYVPHSGITLNKDGGIYSIKPEVSIKESKYSYYAEAGSTSSAKKVTVKRTDGKITGQLYCENLNSLVETDGALNPVIGTKKAILVDNKMTEAAELTYYDANGEAVQTLVKASDGAFVCGDKYFLYDSTKTEFYQVSKSSGTWGRVTNGVVYKQTNDHSWVKSGGGASGEPVEFPFKEQDSDAKFSAIRWIDDGDFTTEINGVTQKGSDYPFTTTKKIKESDTAYYSKVKITVWVEGTDREADIALNGGTFKINLAFGGKAVETEGVNK